MTEKIIILDFGGKQSQLFARNIRDLHVFCEVLPYDTSIDILKSKEVKGIILTGDFNHINPEDTFSYNKEIFSLGIPILGINYGMYEIITKLGGKIHCVKDNCLVETSMSIKQHQLFKGYSDSITVLIHQDNTIQSLPDGFCSIANTKNCSYASIADDSKHLYGVHFSPELFEHGTDNVILKNFLFDICTCTGDWKISGLVDSLINDIKKQAGGKNVLSALSGGVDSSVASVLVHKAIGDKLTCIFVDHGLLRKNEAEDVMKFYHESLGLKIIKIDARKRFLSKLAGVVEPEQKRKIIGEEFIHVFEEEAKKIGAVNFLVQGTIYPDVIESGTSKKDGVIKSHHNVGGLPEHMDFEGIIEPLRFLFKDEVRQLGEALGIPHKLVWRQPFPGPGLAVRVLGEITEEKLEMVRESDAILREEIALAKLDESIWQYFTVFPNVRTVGATKEGRTYDNLIAIRAVTSRDAMTVEIADIPYPILRKLSERIINEVKGVNRVVYDITRKPPGTIEWE